MCTEISQAGLNSRPNYSSKNTHAILVYIEFIYIKAKKITDNIPPVILPSAQTGN